MAFWSPEIQAFPASQEDEHPHSRITIATETKPPCIRERKCHMHNYSISCAEKTSTLQQGSLHCQPKQCSVTIIREIPQNYHRFALFDPQKISKWVPFHVPCSNIQINHPCKSDSHPSAVSQQCRIRCEIFTTEKPNMERRRPPKEQLLLQIRNAISGNSASSAWIS